MLYMLIKRKNDGFSLVELLVVISIIAVLSAVLMANFMGARERARDSQKIQDLYALKNALRLYYNDHQSYPGENDDVSFDLAEDIGSSYMTTISGIGYTYERRNDGDGFVLKVGLEAGAGSDAVDSQTRCDTGAIIPKLFAVCAN